jgi:hypothetical protein
VETFGEGELGELMGFYSPIASKTLHAHMAFQGDIAEKGVTMKRFAKLKDGILELSTEQHGEVKIQLVYLFGGNNEFSMCHGCCL